MKTLIAIMLLVGISVSFTNIQRSKSVALSIKNRTTVDTVAKAHAIIKAYGVGAEKYYVIRLQDQYLNLYCTNIPAYYKKDNTKVIVSGALKLTHNMEDEYGQLFWLHAITADKTE